MTKHRKAPKIGGDVRPTTQKILESLAAILQPYTEGSLVLDLFAGTGSVGLRMLENGAERVIFVEGNRRVGMALKRVLKTTEGTSLVIGAVPQVLCKIKGQFDLILADPPYHWHQGQALLASTVGLAKTGSLLVVEHHHKVAYGESGEWKLWRQEKFGETRLSFFEFAAGPEGAPGP